MEVVGVRISRGFCKRVQSQQVECLHRPAPDARNAQRTLFAVSLGDIDTSERLRMIPSLPERGYGRCFLLGSVPNHLVYSWGSTTFVFRHSSHGKSLAAVRVGQQTLQGFDLAPSAFLRCLHNTRLEPTHVAVNGLPVNVMPSCHTVVGSCTSLFDRHLLCLLDRFALFSCERRPRGSLPAFAWGDLACLLNPYPLHYRGAFAFSTFLYPHLHRLPLRVAFPIPR